MAFLAEFGALTDELVTVITSTSPTSHPQRFNAFRDSALRSLRNRNYLQTNPFAVEEQLRGLVERFSVVGRDGLSDALRQRLDSLSTNTTRFTPEILHLFLELSDRPTQNTSLDFLERLKPPDKDAGQKLRWEDIAREDGWAEDRGLWKNVDFADSSEDEATQDSQSQATDDSSDTSISSATHGRRIAKDLILQQEHGGSAVEAVRKSQEWRHAPLPRDELGRPLKIPISELQILREVLFMLNGLPSDLFSPDCTPVPRFQLADISWDTYRALINSFAECGRTLLPLRKFCETTQVIPMVQAFQDSVSQRLRLVDREIAVLQHRFVDIKHDTVVSLIALQEELRPQLTPLTALGHVVRQLQDERFAHAFRCLELLYDATCIAQLSGDMPTYSFLGTIFFECFRVYTIPIRRWMEEGHLTPGDKTFFVAECASPVPLHLIWSHKYELRRAPDNQLHAPNFLQSALKKVFNTGKSVVVLKQLGRFRSGGDHPADRTLEPPLDFEAICAPPEFALAPFSELFSDAFDLWIQSRYRSTAANLHGILFESCGLWSSFDALQHIYFMSDGSISEAFVSPIFSSLDALDTAWTDRFSLTEVAQEAWSQCPGLEPYRLSAAVDPGHIFHDNPGKARCSVRNTLPGVRLSYRLAWPVRLVITTESIVGYQAIFTLLLQIRRVSALLNKLFTSCRSHDETSEQLAFYSLRSRLLWFTNILQTYLTTVVLAPNIERMRGDVQDAEDVDAMIKIHSAFSRRVMEETFLGAKLGPIKECILDVLDLAIKLEDARHAEEERVAGGKTHPPGREDLPTPSRPGASGGPAGGEKTPRLGVYVSPKEKEREEDKPILFGEDDCGEDEDFGVQDRTGTPRPKQKQLKQAQTYAEVLMGIRADFDRHLRFIAGGLRGVARASVDAAAPKWDTLAEMLEIGNPLPLYQ
jgi:gamma-tubulin complex component 5